MPAQSHIQWNTRYYPILLIDSTQASRAHMHVIVEHSVVMDPSPQRGSGMGIATWLIASQAGLYAR